MNWTKHIQLTTTIHLTLMMTSTQVVEMSVTTTDNSASQDYPYLYIQSNYTITCFPRFKSFTVIPQSISNPTYELATPCHNLSMLLLMGTSPEVNNNCNLCLCQEKFPAK